MPPPSSPVSFSGALSDFETSYSEQYDIDTGNDVPVIDPQVRRVQQDVMWDISQGGYSETAAFWGQLPGNLNGTSAHFTVTPASDIYTYQFQQNAYDSHGMCGHTATTVQRPGGTPEPIYSWTWGN